RLGAEGPCLTEKIAVVDARQTTDRVEEQSATHLDQLRVADVPAPGEVVCVYLAQRGERPPVIARPKDIDVCPCRSNLALLPPPEHEEDVAGVTNHLRVLIVQPVRVDDSLPGGEAGGIGLGRAAGSGQGDHQPDDRQPYQYVHSVPPMNRL